MLFSTPQQLACSRPVLQPQDPLLSAASSTWLRLRRPSPHRAHSLGGARGRGGIEESPAPLLRLHGWQRGPAAGFTGSG